jgi:uncharacterized membrane protein
VTSKARRRLRLAAAGLAVAALAHLLTVWALPRLIMTRATAAIAAETGGGVGLPPPADATQRRIVMPSPDLLYATCVIDLRERALRVRADPRLAGYWSIALYAATSDNVHVLDDRAAGGRPVDWILSGPGTPAAGVPEGATPIALPTDRGLLLMRVLAGDDARRAQADAARRTLRCDPVPAPPAGGAR